MRILLPTMRDVGQVGGTTTHLDMLSRGLNEIGHEAHVLYLGAKVPAAARNLGIVWPAGTLNRVRRGWGMVYASWLRGQVISRLTERELARDAAEQAQREPPASGWEVLNAQDVYSVPGLRVVADRFSLPLVLTLHGYPLYESLSEGYTAASQWGRSYLVRSELTALRLADEIVTVDTRLHDFACRLVPEKAEAVSALMNFIDTSAFYPSWEGREELRRKWDIPQERTVLFCPRRLVKKNGVVYPSLALAAMPPAERGRYLLLHAGEGGERDAIETAVREQGLSGEVRLLGNQDRQAIVELYRLSDVVLVPSIHSENVEEATSLAALEAMASGRPLIAGAVGGLAEIVRDGHNGLLVPGGDAEALAHAIRTLSDSSELRLRLSQAARDYVVATHSHLTAAESFVKIYRRAQERIGEDRAPYRGWGSPPSGAERTAAVGKGGVGATVPLGMPTFRSTRILGLPLDLVTPQEAVTWVMAAARRPEGGRTLSAVSFNPEIVMRAQKDPRVAEAIMEADLRFPDGVGAVWAAGQQGLRDLERVPGIELAEQVVAVAAQESLPVYFLGAGPGVAEEAAERLKERLPGLAVAGTHHGYFGPEEDASVAEEVRASGAAILLVAMGAPRQEIFVFQQAAHLRAGVALGVGGSFDVWSGRARRAPGWARDMKVEWLWRLARDPKRWRRQAQLPRFAYRVKARAHDDYRLTQHLGKMVRPEASADSKPEVEAPSSPPVAEN